MYNNKTISPVVATALLLVVAVIAVVSFQGWIATYSSTVFVDVETRGGIESLTIGIENLIGNKLYFLNNLGKNITVIDVSIEGVSCGINSELVSGVNELIVSSCVANLNPGSSVDVLVVTNEKLFSKKMIIGNVNDICDNLVLLMHFDNNSGYAESNSFFFDYSGYSNSGVCYSSDCPIYNSTVSLFDLGLTYDGDDSFVNTSLNNNLDLITISAWIYPETYGETLLGHVFAKDNGVLSEHWAYLFGGMTRLQFNSGFDTQEGEWYTPSGSILVGNSYHVVIVYNASSVANDPIIYLNGVSQVVAEQITPIGNHVATTNPFRVGNVYDKSRGFEGVIDEFAIWNRLLSAEEVLQINNSVIDC